MSHKIFLMELRIIFLLLLYVFATVFQIADGGHRLQIWRVSANILNKQSLITKKEWSCKSGFIIRLTSTVNIECYEILHRVSDSCGFFWNVLSKEKWIWDLTQNLGSLQDIFVKSKISKVYSRFNQMVQESH
jgi:hypothetical protein